MPQMTSVQQAAQNALATWIASQLATALPTLKVEPRWPDPDRVLAQAITVVRIGRMKREITEPVVVGQVNNPDNVTAVYTWRTAFCEQALQLDVWATDDFMRDDMIARLEPVLHAGLQSIGMTGQDPVENELLLTLGDGWTGWAGFVFDEPEIADSPDDIKQSEYRATIRGAATFNLTIDATSPRLARAHIRERLRESDIASQTESYGTATAANDGTTTFALS